MFDLKTSNMIPYLVILVMGYVLYLEWEAKREAQKERDEVWQTMSIIQSRNEERFSQLRGIDKEWKVGKHKKSI